MKGFVISILIFSTLLLVFFVNFNNDINEHVWNLIYYTQYYVLVGFSIVLIWILFSDKLTRILTVPIGLYYIFHLTINIIEIFDQPLKEQLYRTKYINYGLVLGMGFSIIIAYFISSKKTRYFKKVIRKKIKK